MEQKRNNNFLNTLLTLLILILAGLYLWDRFGTTAPDVPDMGVVLEDILDAPTFATLPASTPVPLVELLQSTPTPTAEWMEYVDAGATADTIVATPDSAGVYAYETERGGTLWTYLNPGVELTPTVNHAPTVDNLPAPTAAWAGTDLHSWLQPTAEPTPTVSVEFVEGSSWVISTPVSCKPPMACAANTPTP